MTSRTLHRRELKGGHVLAAMLFFFGAIIAINVAFTVAAVRTFPGEDERRSYLQGLRYNETLAEREQQKALGWRAGMEIIAAGATPQLMVTFADRDGRPIDGLTIEGELRRPATTRDDATLTFTGEGDGVYVADISSIPAGGWTFHGVAQRGAQKFEFERRMTWTPPR